MTTDHEFALVASTTDVQKVFVAIELGKSTWVVAIQPPAVDKVSLFRIAGGEIERLFELFEQARRRARQPIEICACYEAGHDGFWIYRALTARGVACTVLDSASIQVSRRARRVKTDRTDAESLVRVTWTTSPMWWNARSIRRVLGDVHCRYALRSMWGCDSPLSP
jgi:transposase